MREDSLCRRQGARTADRRHGGSADPHRADQKGPRGGPAGRCIPGALPGTRAPDRSSVPRPRPRATERSGGAQQRAVETPDVRNGHRHEVFSAHACPLPERTDWWCRQSHRTIHSAPPPPPRTHDCRLRPATLLGSQGPRGGRQEGPHCASTTRRGRARPRWPRALCGRIGSDGLGPEAAARPLQLGGRRLWPSHGWFLRGPRRPQALGGKHLPAPAAEDQRARPLPFLRLPWLRAKDRAVRACWVPRGWGPQAGSIITTTP